MDAQQALERTQIVNDNRVSKQLAEVTQQINSSIDRGGFAFTCGRLFVENKKILRAKGYMVEKGFHESETYTFISWAGSSVNDSQGK